MNATKLRVSRLAILTAGMLATVLGVCVADPMLECLNLNRNCPDAHDCTEYLGENQCKSIYEGPEYVDYDATETVGFDTGTCTPGLLSCSTTPEPWACLRSRRGIPGYSFGCVAGSALHCYLAVSKGTAT